MRILCGRGPRKEGKMSIKNECEIVRDLLPLYAENMVCGETAEFVRDHLEGCASCRAELEQIGSGQSDEKEKNDERRSFFPRFSSRYSDIFHLRNISRIHRIRYPSAKRRTARSPYPSVKTSRDTGYTKKRLPTARMYQSTASKRGRLFSTECFFIPDGKTP